MEKLKKLKKRVAIEAGILFAVAGVFSGIYWFVDDLVVQAEAEETKITGEVRGLESQITEEERIVGVVKTSITAYNEIKENMDSHMYALDRTKAETILSDLKTQLRLDKFTATLAPEKTVVGVGYDGKRVSIISSEVKVSFSALSDMHVYLFIDTLKKLLPGYVRVTAFSVKRDVEPAPEILVKISRGENVSIVSATLEFIWLGMKIAPKPDPNAAPPAAAFQAGE